MAFSGRGARGSVFERPGANTGRKICSIDMFCDLVCFVILGLLACYFLQYIIARVIEDHY